MGSEDPASCRKATDAVTGELDPRCEAAVERWVAAAPPLTEAQKDIISAAMRGALKPPGQASAG
jgi:hypothetical protein